MDQQQLIHTIQILLNTNKKQEDEIQQLTNTIQIVRSIKAENDHKLIKQEHEIKQRKQDIKVQDKEIQSLQKQVKKQIYQYETLKNKYDTLNNTHKNQLIHTTIDNYTKTLDEELANQKQQDFQEEWHYWMENSDEEIMQNNINEWNNKIKEKKDKKNKEFLSELEAQSDLTIMEWLDEEENKNDQKKPEPNRVLNFNDEDIHI